MPDSIPNTALAEVVPVTPAVRGRPGLAWIVILAVVTLLVWLQNRRPEVKAPREESELASRILQVQGQFLVALSQFVNESDPQLGEQLAALNRGPVEDRLRVAILAGEVQGPEAALEILDDLSQGREEQAAAGAVAGAAAISLHPAPRHRDLAAILRRLYRDYANQEFAAPSVKESAKERLRKELGWFGDLALAPAKGPDQAARAAVLQSANRVLFTTAGIVLAVLLVVLVGFVGLVVFFILLFTEKLQAGFQPGSPYGGVYAETFAVWLILFLALQQSVGFIPLPNRGLLLTGAALFLSLTALAWPVMRGVPWQQVRADVGLTAGRQPRLEPFLGVWTYVLAVPLAVVGMLVTALLLSSPLGEAARQPSHPVVEVIPRVDWWGRVQIVLIACVAAPLVEETFFRGVLFRHLRESTNSLGRPVSVLLSAGLSSFLFALVHPQGILGVPPLMGLAIAFSLVREWRGTLVPAMVAHGITNGVSLLGVLFLLGD